MARGSGVESIKELEIFVHFSAARQAWVLHPLIVAGQPLPPRLIVEEPIATPPDDLKGEIILFNRAIVEPLVPADIENGGSVRDAFVAVNDVNGRLNQVEDSLGIVEAQVQQFNAQSKQLNDTNNRANEGGGRLTAMQQKLEMMHTQMEVHKRRAATEESRAERAVQQLQTSTRRHQQELTERGLYAGAIGEKFKESVDMFAKLKAEERIADEIRDQVLAAEKETIERRRELMKHIQEAKQQHMTFMQAKQSLAERHREVEMEAALLKKEKSSFAEERSMERDQLCKLRAEAAIELSASGAANLAMAEECQAKAQCLSRLHDEECAAQQSKSAMLLEYMSVRDRLRNMRDEESLAEQGKSAVLLEYVKVKDQLHTISNEVCTAQERAQQERATAQDRVSRIRAETSEALEAQEEARQECAREKHRVNRIKKEAAVASSMLQEEQSQLDTMKAEAEETKMRAAEESNSLSEYEAEIQLTERLHQEEIEKHKAEVEHKQSEIGMCEGLFRELEERIQQGRQEVAEQVEVQKDVSSKAACAQAAELEKMAKRLANPLRLLAKAFIKQGHDKTELGSHLVQVAADSRTFAIKAMEANRSSSQQCAVFNQNVEQLRELLQGKAKGPIVIDGDPPDVEWDNIAYKCASCFLAVVGLLQIGGPIAPTLAEDCLEKLAWVFDKGTRYARSKNRQHLADVFAPFATFCLIHSNARDRLVTKIEDQDAKKALNATRKILETGTMQSNLAEALAGLEELTVSKDTRQYRDITKFKLNRLRTELNFCCGNVKTVTQSMAAASRVCQAWRIHDTYLPSLRRTITGSTSCDRVSVRPPFLPVLAEPNPAELVSLLRELAIACCKASSPCPAAIHLSDGSSLNDDPQDNRPHKRLRPSTGT